MNIDTQDIFTGGKSLDEIRIETAKDVLMEAGYKILSPITVDGSINTITKLCDYFYKRLYTKYPNRITKRVHNITKDMTLMNSFVECFMDGASKARAIQEAIEVIDVIFDHEEEFNFKLDIVDTGILGQKAVGWITSKAIDILNKQRMKKESKKINDHVEALENCDINTDEIDSKLDRLLKKMEDNN